MKHILLTVLLVLPLVAFSQTPVLSEDIIGDTIPEKFGPNRKHFYHNYVGVGFAVAGGGPKASSTFAETNALSSTDLQLGFRYKRRFCDAYSLGLELGYRLTGFNYKQSNLKTFPTPTLHQREKININAVNLGLFNRFNFDKRGNYIGKFIDIGGFSDIIFRTTYRVRDNIYSTVLNDHVHRLQKISGLDITNNFNYGLLARLGFNKFVFYSTYRLSDLFNKDIYPEAPRLIVGLQLGLHK